MWVETIFLKDSKKGVGFVNEFKGYHPIVNFTYFAFVIGFSMFFMNPVCLVISFISAFCYSVILDGKKAVRTNLLYMLPVMITTALLNPLFNHQGITMLLYLPSGNPLTLESIIYGVSASVMLVTVICWFSCYNKVMTIDKFVYLFGRIMPSLSLVFSMTLRFVPKFSEQLKNVTKAQKCIGRDLSSGGIIKRVKYGLAILSSMITWALENAIETSDSMKARGYGLSGRTAFSIFVFDKRDKLLLFVIVFSGLYILVGKIFGKLDFSYFPQITGEKISLYGISIFFIYLILCILPVIIEIREVLKWKSLK